MYKINNKNEIHDVLLIKLIINVKMIDCVKMIKLDLKGDFINVKIIDKIKFNDKIILIIIQYIF